MKAPVAASISAGTLAIHFYTVKKIMRSISLSLLVALSLMLTGCATSMSAKEWNGQEAPTAQIYMLDGDVVALDSYRGKTVVLLFWGNWCSRSQQSIRKLDALAVRLSGRKDVVYIAASIDKAEKLDDVKQTLRDANLTHITPAFSGNEIYDEGYMAFECQMVPAFFVINPTGTVIASGTDITVVEEAFGLIHN